MINEKRKHERVYLPAIISISDNQKICDADIIDVSFGGIAIKHVLSSMLNGLPKVFTAVISYRGGNAKVTLAPKWYKKETNTSYSIVGFKIIGPQDIWHTFMRRATGQVDNSKWDKPIDAWGTADTKHLHRKTYDFN